MTPNFNNESIIRVVKIFIALKRRRNRFRVGRIGPRRQRERGAAPWLLMKAADTLP